MIKNYTAFEGYILKHHTIRGVLNPFSVCSHAELPCSVRDTHIRELLENESIESKEESVRTGQVVVTWSYTVQLPK